MSGWDNHADNVAEAAFCAYDPRPGEYHLIAVRSLLHASGALSRKAPKPFWHGPTFRRGFGIAPDA